MSHIDMDAAISEAARKANFGQNLADRGITTVAIDELGRLIQYRPDGTTAPINAEPSFP